MVLFCRHAARAARMAQQRTLVIPNSRTFNKLYVKIFNRDLWVRQVNRSPGGCGVVLYLRGHWHHFVLCVFGAGVPNILPGFPVAEGHWQCWACAVGGS